MIKNKLILLNSGSINDLYLTEISSYVTFNLITSHLIRLSHTVPLEISFNVLKEMYHSINLYNTALCFLCRLFSQRISLWSRKLKNTAVQIQRKIVFRFESHWIDFHINPDRSDTNDKRLFHKGVSFYLSENLGEGQELPIASDESYCLKHDGNKNSPMNVSSKFSIWEMNSIEGNSGFHWTNNIYCIICKKCKCWRE